MGIPRILLVLTMLVPPTVCPSPPEPYEAVYDISRGVLKVGTMTRRLQFDDSGQYVFESHMKTRGLVALFSRDNITETSRGHLDGLRFMPVNYDYVHSDEKRSYSLHFDHEAGVVRRVDDASDWSSEMPAAVLDKLVYQAQLTFDLTQRPDTINYEIADKTKLKSYLIRNLGSEEVETDVGHFATLKLERASTGSMRRTRVWCAPELGWLAVRVEHRDDEGAVTVAVLQSLARP